MASRTGVVPQVVGENGEPKFLKYFNSEYLAQEIKKRGGSLPASYFREVFEMQMQDLYQKPMKIEDLVQAAKDGTQFDELKT
jgi:hypothetical protein